MSTSISSASAVLPDQRLSQDLPIDQSDYFYTPIEKAILGTLTSFPSIGAESVFKYFTAVGYPRPNVARRLFENDTKEEQPNNER